MHMGDATEDVITGPRRHRNFDVPPGEEVHDEDSEEEEARRNAEQLEAEDEQVHHVFQSAPLEIYSFSALVCLDSYLQGLQCVCSYLNADTTGCVLFCSGAQWQQQSLCC